MRGRLDAPHLVEGNRFEDHEHSCYRTEWPLLGGGFGIDGGGAGGSGGRVSLRRQRDRVRLRQRLDAATTTSLDPAAALGVPAATDARATQPEAATRLSAATRPIMAIVMHRRTAFLRISEWIELIEPPVDW